MSELFGRLEKLIEPTIRLLLFNGELDVEEYWQACQLYSNTLTTKCGHMDVALYYLLDFQPASCNRPSYSKVDSNYRDENINSSSLSSSPDDEIFEDNKAYIYTLEGVTPAIEGSLREQLDNLSKIGHILTLLFDVGHWRIFDAYINCREFSEVEIELETFIEQLKILSNSSNTEVWYQLTGCREHDPRTLKFNIERQCFYWTSSHIEQRFANLIETARDRLNDKTVYDPMYYNTLLPDINTDDFTVAELESLAIDYLDAVLSRSSPTQ